jgi:hypothetical protein
LRAALKAATARGALVHVGGDDLGGVPGQVERLDATAGAEVERAAHRLAQGQLRERGGGGADAEDVVVGDADLLAVEPGGQVGDDPPVVVVVGVGAAVEERAHLTARADEQARRDKRVDEAGEGPVGGRAVDLGLEQEQAHQGRQW